MKRLKLDMAAKGHALLSASSSHIWLACTPSARLAEFIEDQDSTAFSEENKELAKDLKTTLDIEKHLPRLKEIFSYLLSLYKEEDL